MATREQIETALRNAHAAGDTASARKLANALKSMAAESAAVEEPVEQPPSIYERKGSQVNTGADSDTLNVLGEIAAGANSGFMAIPDTLMKAGHLSAQGYQALATLAKGGSLQDAVAVIDPPSEAPTLSGAVEQVTGQRPGDGGFMEPGPVRDYVYDAAEVGIPAVVSAIPVAGRNLTKPAEAIAETLGFGSAKSPAAVTAQTLDAMNSPGPAAPAPFSGDKPSKVTRDLAVLKGEGDVAGAGYKLDDAGNVIEDILQKQAIKNGMKKGVVAMIKDSTPRGKQIMLNMVDEIERGMENAAYKIRNRPLAQTGKSVADRVRLLNSHRKSAGRKLSQIAKALEGRPVNINGPANRFVQSMSDNYNVTFSVGDDGLIAANFDGSTFEGMDTLQGMVNRVVKRMRDAKRIDARGAHDLKRFIDEQVAYVKNDPKGGMTAQLENTFKDLRRGVNQVLGSQFPEYAATNKKYSDIVGVLGEVQRIAGRNTDIYGASSNEALGQLMRGLLSNNKSRVPLTDAIAKLDDLAKQYGGEKVAARFDDDILAQVKFVDDLERMFGSDVVAETGFKGQSLDNVPRTEADAAVKLASKVVKKLTKKDERQILDSIRALLKDGTQ